MQVIITTKMGREVIETAISISEINSHDSIVVISYLSDGGSIKQLFVKLDGCTEIFVR